MEDDSDKQIFLRVARFLEAQDPNVLEIGCGDGRISRWLIDETDNLIGVDPNPERIKAARANIPKGKFVVASGEHLGFPNEAFDLVLFTLSLHHQDGRKSLREAARVLKENGSVLVIEPLMEGEIERVFAVVHNEGPAKLDAQRAITESDLSLEASEVFLAHWVFDDKDELINHLFDYYDVAFSSTSARQICGVLGDKAQDRPLRLSDHMIIHTLSKHFQPEVT